MKVRIFSLTLFLLLLFCFHATWSQGRLSGSRYTINKKYTSVGISLNAINYFGDLAPKEDIFSTNISFTRPDFGIWISRRLGPRFSVRGSFNWGRLKGDDFESADPNDENAVYRYIRNLQFRNDIKELSVVGIVDLFENPRTFRTRRPFNPYVFAGVAVFHHNPKALVPEIDQNTGNTFPNAGEWVDLQPLRTEGEDYKKIQIAIPFGVGFRFRLEERWDLALEVGYRHLFFDRIDDVSGNYVDLGTLDSDLARALSDRSREPVAVESGDTRVFTPPATATYVGADGNTYTTFGGYGNPDPSNIRGDKDDNDIYIVTGIHLSYILSTGRYRRAKFR